MAISSSVQLEWTSGQLLQGAGPSDIQEKTELNEHEWPELPEFISYILQGFQLEMPLYGAAETSDT